MVNNNEESDYEDMMTPTDDEGATSLNHTQKIPISMIKAKDKASVSIAHSSTFQAVILLNRDGMVVGCLSVLIMKYLNSSTIHYYCSIYH